MGRKISYSLLALILVFSIALGNVSVASSSGSLRNKKNTIDKNIETKKNEINKLKKESSDLTKEMDKLDKEETEASNELEEIEEELKELNTEIEETEKELEAAKNQVEEKQESLNSRLRVMYKKGGVGFLEVLLSSADIRDFLVRKDMVQTIVNHDVDLLEYIKEQKDIVEKKRTELRSQRASVQAAREKAKEKKDQLVAVTRSKEALMKELNKDIEVAEAEYAKLEKESKQIADEIARLQAISESEGGRGGQTSKPSKPGSNNPGNNNSNPSPPPQSGSGMIWPTAAGAPITSPFGPRWGRMHNGIDIGVGIGTPVYAADSGTVIMTRVGTGSSYGNYLVIDHGGGISTLYAHNSTVTVSPGQRVSKGQVVAKSGNTGRSTGPHLHFEVRVNGNPVNPLGYVSR